VCRCRLRTPAATGRGWSGTGCPGDLLVGYLAALGVTVDDDACYGRAVLVTQRVGWPSRTESLRQARARWTDLLRALHRRARSGGWRFDRSDDEGNRLAADRAA
jgi:hypothetical protein